MFIASPYLKNAAMTVYCCLTCCVIHISLVGALACLLFKQELSGKPAIEIFPSCLYGVGCGIGAYLTGRFFTTPTSTS